MPSNKELATKLYERKKKLADADRSGKVIPPTTKHNTPELKREDLPTIKGNRRT